MAAHYRYCAPLCEMELRRERGQVGVEPGPGGCNRVGLSQKVWTAASPPVEVVA